MCALHCEDLALTTTRVNSGTTAEITERQSDGTCASIVAKAALFPPIARNAGGVAIGTFAHGNDAGAVFQAFYGGLQPCPLISPE